MNGKVKTPIIMEVIDAADTLAPSLLNHRANIMPTSDLTKRGGQGISRKDIGLFLALQVKRKPQ